MLQPLLSADTALATRTWNLGFSDYFVPMYMTEKMIKDRIESLHLSWELSCVYKTEKEGYAGIMLAGIQPFKERKQLWIGGMAVIPEFRRQSIARTLMDHAQKSAIDHNCDDILLEVIKGNARAYALYEGLGFSMMNELIVGELNQAPAEGELITFEKADPLELKNQEHELTPWQNRLDENSTVYHMYAEGENIGYIFFTESQKENGQKMVSIRQLVLHKESKEHIENILHSLSSRGTGVRIQLSNLITSQPECELLREYGMQSELFQFQMKKLLK
ncbi:GNAT family N-acetyltransferase [Halobacillus massiliensis]|uniref:GNAT family N-acetyltransferase n=1 Tax=Halobacillus massiliensis TaxID=1926286 RepID=UPI0009E54428|nr:GNAT family N-acetyltransferase [Halobacillus massiliensis]